MSNSTNTPSTSSKRKADGVEQDKPAKKNKIPKREYADDEFVFVTYIGNTASTHTGYLVKISSLPGGDLTILRQELDLINRGQNQDLRRFVEGEEVPRGSEGEGEGEDILEGCLEYVTHRIILDGGYLVLPKSVKVVAFFTATRC